MTVYDTAINDLEDAIHDLFGYRMSMENHHEKARTERAMLLAHLNLLRGLAQGGQERKAS